MADDVRATYGGAAVNAGVVALATAPGSPGAGTATPLYDTLVNAKGQGAGLATYVASGQGYAAYATPTDMLVLTGSASKTILVTQAVLFIASTAVAAQTIYFIKRTAANTGGTSAAQTLVSMDSTNPAATATVALYSAAPTGLGASAGNVFVGSGNSNAGTVPNGAGVGLQSALRGPSQAVIDLRQPITLRGVGESLAINYNGAALTAGFIANWFIELVEY